MGTREVDVRLDNSSGYNRVRNNRFAPIMVAGVVGLVLGYFIGINVPHLGDGIVAAAIRTEAISAVLNGNDRNLAVFNTETGQEVLSCKDERRSEKCSTKVVFGEFGEPKLVYTANNQPVPSDKIMSSRKTYQFRFHGSHHPRHICEQTSSNGNDTETCHWTTK